MQKVSLPLTRWQLFTNMAELLTKCDYYKIKNAMETEKDGTNPLFEEMQISRMKFLKSL